MTEGLSIGNRLHSDVTVPRGFPAEIVDADLNSKYRCAICRLILRDPFQSSCGHRFCKECVGYLLRSISSSSPDGAPLPVCAACQEEDTVDDSSIIQGDQLYKDNALQKEMHVLAVHCCNTDCQWKGLFKDYENHSNVCDHEVIECEYCKERIPRHFVERHTSREHMLMTARPGQLCPFSCGMTIEEHGIRKHIEMNLAIHLDVLNDKLETVEQLLASPQQRLGNNSSGSTLLERVIGLEQFTMELETRFRGTSSTQQSEHQAPETSSLPVRGPDVDFRGIPEFLDIVIRGAKVVKLEQERLSRRLRSFVAQCAEDTKKEQSLKCAIEAREKAAYASCSVLNEVELRIQTLETIMTDGVLIWKITDFDRRLSEAVAGTTTSLDSSPFFTHPTGYKMCARIYLNGDETAKGSHLSLFFVIMRGNYDALLAWPFDLRVTFAILDQDDVTHSHVDSFRPDASNTSFRRPSAEMNPDSGFPNFMSLNLLEKRRCSLVKDNVMFVKVTVDAQELAGVEPRTSMGRQ